MPTHPRAKVLSWGSDVEDKTLDDAACAASLACVPSHVALMPDAHTGYGPPIRTVIRTLGAVIPYAIGVDIGCGMTATETDLVASDLPDSLRRLMPLIEQRIPAGMGRRLRGAPRSDTPAGLGAPGTELTDRQQTTAATQFGTFGRATTSSRSAWTRPTTSGSCCTAAPAGSATSWRSGRSPRPGG